MLAPLALTWRPSPALPLLLQRRGRRSVRRTRQAPRWCWGRGSRPSQRPGPGERPEPPSAPRVCFNSLGVHGEPAAALDLFVGLLPLPSWRAVAGPAGRANNAEDRAFLRLPLRASLGPWDWLTLRLSIATGGWALGPGALSALLARLRRGEDSDPETEALRLIGKVRCWSAMRQALCTPGRFTPFVAPAFPHAIGFASAASSCFPTVVSSVPGARLRARGSWLPGGPRSWVCLA